MLSRLTGKRQYKFDRYSLVASPHPRGIETSDYDGGPVLFQYPIRFAQGSFWKFDRCLNYGFPSPAPSIVAEA